MSLGFLVGILLLQAVPSWAQTSACYQAFQSDAKAKTQELNKKLAKNRKLGRAALIGGFLGGFFNPLVMSGALLVGGYVILRKNLAKTPESEKVLELFAQGSLRRLVHLTKEARKYDPSLSREGVQAIIAQGMSSGALCPDGPASLKQIEYYVLDQAYKNNEAKKLAGQEIAYSDVTRAYSQNLSCLNEYAEYSDLKEEKRENVRDISMKALTSLIAGYLVYTGIDVIPGVLESNAADPLITQTLTGGMLGTLAVQVATAIPSRPENVLYKVTAYSSTGQMGRVLGNDTATNNYVERLAKKAREINPSLSEADSLGHVISIIKQGFDTRDFCKARDLYNARDIKKYVLARIPVPADQTGPQASIEVNDSEESEDACENDRSISSVVKVRKM